ncbi:phage tail tape measure protein [Microbacterium sp. A1-JK]|uniref:phage tail tape measure protein n=1 Tax=Microbacterium sp. A1-JK TaxID=3177516 RepID=UPI0038871BEA
MSTELATAYIALVPSMKGAQGEIAKSILPDAQAAGDNAGKESGSRFGAAFKGALGAAAIGAAVVAGFAGLYKVGSIFDDVSDTIRVGTGATGEALRGLEEDAKRVAQTVPASFESAGQTVADLNTRLGLSGTTLQTVASQYLEAGRILGEEVDINATTAAFSAFGIEGDAVSGAMDDLFRVSQATGVGMNELAGSVQKNAPAVQALGFSFLETASLAGSLDKAGLNTGQVMGALSKSLVTLAKSGEEPQDAFRRTVDEIGGFIDAGNTAAAIDLAGKVFGTRGASQLVGAIQSGTLALDDLVASAGTTDDTILGVASETRDFAESWQLLKNNALGAIEPIGSAVFGLASGAMAQVADAAIALSPLIAGAFERVLPVISTVFEGVSALGSLLFAGDFTGGLSKVFGIQEDDPLVGTILSIRDAFAGVFTAIGPLVGVVVSLWTQFSPLSLILQALMPVLPMLLDAFVGLATVLGGTLASVLGTLVAALTPVIEMLAGELSNVLVTLAPVIVTVATTIASVLATALQALSPLLSLVVGLIGSVLGAVLPLIEPILSLAMAFLPLLQPIIQLVGSLLTPLIGLLTAILTPVLALISPLVDLLAGALGVVIGVLTTLIGWIVQGITWFIQLVTGSQTAQAGITAAWSAVGSFFGQVWSNIIGFFSNGIAQVMGFVSGLRDTVVGVLQGAGRWLVDSGRAIIQGLIDGILGMINNVGNAIGGVMDFIGGFFPRSPAKRGPFSGAGWTRVKKSGGALGDQFTQGFAEAASLDAAMSGITDVTPASAFYPRNTAAVAPEALNSAGYALEPSAGSGDTFYFQGVTTDTAADEIGSVIEKKKRRRVIRSGALRAAGVK